MIKQKVKPVRPIEDLPRAIWGVQPEAVEEQITALVSRCAQLEGDLDMWRERALRAEAEVQLARSAAAQAQAHGGGREAARIDGSTISSGAQAEAAAAHARWEAQLRQAEEELATTRAQIDALRKDFLALLEGVSTAVAQRGDRNTARGPAPS